MRTSFDNQDPLKRSKSRKSKREKEFMNFLDKPKFFNESELRDMIAQNFEYLHNSTRDGFNNVYGDSIFKNMMTLMKPHKELSEDNINQSNFLRKIQYSLRVNP